MVRFGCPSFVFPEGAEGVRALTPFLCFLQLVQDIARLRRRSLRHSRQLDFPKPYIAARFRSLPSHFILGDMKHYDNFENRALEPGQKYVIFILAVLQEPEAVSAACFPSPSSDARDPAVPIIDQRQQLQGQLSCELPAGLVPSWHPPWLSSTRCQGLRFFFSLQRPSSPAAELLRAAIRAVCACVCIQQMCFPCRQQHKHLVHRFCVLPVCLGRTCYICGSSLEIRLGDPDLLTQEYTRVRRSLGQTPLQRAISCEGCPCPCIPSGSDPRHPALRAACHMSWLLQSSPPSRKGRGALLWKSRCALCSFYHFSTSADFSDVVPGFILNNYFNTYLSFLVNNRKQSNSLLVLNPPVE